MIDPLSKWLHRNAGQHGPVMLMYHSVMPGDDTPAWPWAVSMHQFRAQLDFLVSEGYSTPTMGELAAMDRPPKGRTAVITFDDGYIDNLAALEELQKRGIRASWFIVSGSIGQTPHWDADDRPQGRLLNAVELRAMLADGMEIGSHSVNHPHLTTLDDVSLSMELANSKSTLEDALSHEVTSFAYPYGDWNTHIASATEQAGYKAACTTRTGWAMRDKHRFTLRRLTVYNTDTVSTLARKLAYAANDVGWPQLIRQQFSRRFSARS